MTSLHHHLGNLPNRSKVFSLALLLSLCAFVNVSHGAQQFNRSPGWPGSTLAGHPCYGPAQGYGPFDYVTEKSNIRVVEAHHFTPQIEQLVRPKSGNLDSNFDYTLRAVPNHHRALWANARHYIQQLDRLPPDAIQIREQTGQGFPPPECYFQRAKAFNPSDPFVSLIYGTYLHQRDLHDLALAQYKEAERSLPKHSELLYNIGLLYFDLGKLDKAKEYADSAQRQGYPLRGLHNKIQTAKDSKNESTAN